MIAQTRDDALEQLAEHARSVGANAVLGMRFDSGEFDAGQGQAMNEVTAYGTARWWWNTITQSSQPFATGYWPEVSVLRRWSLRLCVGFCIWFSVSSSLRSHSTPNLGLHSTIQDGI